MRDGRGYILRKVEFGRFLTFLGKNPQKTKKWKKIFFTEMAVARRRRVVAQNDLLREELRYGRAQLLA